MTLAQVSKGNKIWLPAEPGVKNPALSARLTQKFLQPVLPALEAFLLDLRRQVDFELTATSPQKYGKSYPLSQCLEISKAVQKLVGTVDANQLSGPVLIGCLALRGFLAAGGEMRRVWGDLRGSYFQNAFQIGTLYVDVANDTVVPSKPKVEILPFEASGLVAIKDYSHFAKIAESYWSVTAWPNHVYPEIAPFFPLLIETQVGSFELRDPGGYMMGLNLNRAFKPAEAYLTKTAMPEEVRERAAYDLAPLAISLPNASAAGRHEGLKALQRYRSKAMHRDPVAQKRLTERGFAANRLFQTAAKSRSATPAPTEKSKKPPMNILFIHQNFPGQFKHLAPALAKGGHRVVALTMQKVKETRWQGVELVPYSVTQGSTPGTHPWVVDFETKIIRAEGAFRACLKLKEQGFEPDAIIAHPGWGESLFLKEVWPQARLGIFCEFFYLAEGADTGFDPEFPVEDVAGNNCRLRLKNLNNYMHFDVADAAIAPTVWQASTFPEPFRSKITVVHDGIDTQAIQPNPNVSLKLRQTGSDKPLTLSRDDEVITFVNRNLEPMRGCHIFLRALPELLKQRPRAQVIIVGGDGVSYGAKPTVEKNGAASWKDVFINEVRGQIPDADWARVHFVGQVPYANFLSLLQLSTVHVYWTYPFVLSWSLIEAMSAGAAIVASDTAPLREVIQHDENGLLVDFFSVGGVVQSICGLLDDPNKRERLGAAARGAAVTGYDLNTVCLPKQLAWVEALSNHHQRKG
ncbi:glycosyltransferase involved in cell wall biosynthesis [Loktanella sp. PT4BL]|jgi:glycosyltransferase involved in cell wall biosynthesis|nr:glycosyltransferase involved in cell wall biosynthesis [Loktanella sp. PT4BL]